MQHEVCQTGEVVEIALADVLRQPLDSRRLPAANLRVDLGDVEDVDLAPKQLVEAAFPAMTFVVVAGDDCRRVGCELGDALEYVLRRVGREVGDQLVVDRQVRREHKEVVDPVR